MAILMNAEDMARLGFQDQDLVDVETRAEDGVERRALAYRVHSFGLPKGNVGGYYPELNRLMPLWHHSKESETPVAKAIPVRIRRSAAPAA